MIRKNFAIFTILGILAFLLCTCGDGSIENAKISISFGMPPGKAAVEIEQLRHVITLYGPSGKKTITISGAGTANASVVPGTWEIDVEGYLGDILYSVGSTTAEVRAGRSTKVSVDMTVVWSDSAGVPAKSTYSITLDQSGTVSITEIVGYSTPPIIPVIVSNTGTGATGLLDVSIDNTSEFSLSTTTINTIAPGGTDTFDVEPILGLPPATYTATVTVSSATNGINASFNVSFTVTATTSYTVTFNSNGGSAVSPQTVSQGTTATVPTPPTRAFTAAAGLYLGTISTQYNFVEWQLGGSAFNFSTLITGDITLDAVWTPNLIAVAPNDIPAAITYANGIPATYTLVIDGNITSLLPQTINAGVKITLIGLASERTITLGSTGTLFTISGIGAELTLGENIKLQGISGNNDSVVRVLSYGKLIMTNGSAITGNTNSNGEGGGVYVGSSGTLNMQDNAEIYGNTVQMSGPNGKGGGLFVANGGTLTMQNYAKVRNNTSLDNGGGVYCLGTFTMEDSAEVYSNQANWGGGGVLVEGGTFTMQNNTKVYNNIATSQNGGGISVFSGGTIVMLDNVEVYGNTASSGGGVSVGSGGSFLQMEGGTIYGNTELISALRNNAGTNAALHFDSSPTAEYGTFSGATWNPAGTLTATDLTIKVISGVLQP